MALEQDLPPEVFTLLSSGYITQYATISAAGTPIDTPVLYFPSEGLRSFDLATGLSYPIKAERARRNPKVGLLVQGTEDEPVVAITGMASVRDANLQANVDRYLSEAGHTLPFNPDWELARQAVWYWTRILVEVYPVSICWWEKPSAMTSLPQCWRAGADAFYPPSDPAPAGSGSKAATWKEADWRVLASAAMERNARAHLTVIDDQGFPVPAPVIDVEAHADGFSLRLPPGLPWALRGKACLTFGGIETFLGEVCREGDEVVLRVARSLPVFPMTQDQQQLWEPTPDTRSQLMRRLTEETERRGLPIPTIPLEKPAPTQGYQRRLDRLARLKAAAG